MPLEEERELLPDDTEEERLLLTDDEALLLREVPEAERTAVPEERAVEEAAVRVALRAEEPLLRAVEEAAAERVVRETGAVDALRAEADERVAMPLETPDERAAPPSALKPLFRMPGRSAQCDMPGR